MTVPCYPILDESGDYILDESGDYIVDEGSGLLVADVTILDEAGNPILDEAGEPILDERCYTEVGGFTDDGEQHDHHPPFRKRGTRAGRRIERRRIHAVTEPLRAEILVSVAGDAELVGGEDELVMLLL